MRISTFYKSSDVTGQWSTLVVMAELFGSLKNSYKNSCNGSCAYYLLFLHLDGATTGPKCGLLRTDKKASHIMHGTEYNTSYQPISLLQQLPHVDVKDLSTDQKYLQQMCPAVSEGHCPSDLALQ